MATPTDQLSEQGRANNDRFQADSLLHSLSQTPGYRPFQQTRYTLPFSKSQSELEPNHQQAQQQQQQQQQQQHHDGRFHSETFLQSIAQPPPPFGHQSLSAQQYTRYKSSGQAEALHTPYWGQTGRPQYSYQQQSQQDGMGGHHLGQPLDQEQTKQLLRQINTTANKEGILELVASFLPKLDLINQVTCLYRLAKMYSSLRSIGMKNQWRSELSSHPVLYLLLESIKAAVSAQPGALPAGLNARCISNLVWSLVRLELVADSTSSAGAILMNAAVLVENFLPHFNSQGLASLLWGYAKLPQPQLRIAMLLIRRITELLADGGSLAMFDAQGLSNSVWALAHMSFILGSKAPELLIQTANDVGTDINRFLSLIGDGTTSILSSVDASVGVLPDDMTVFSCGSTARSWIQDAERKFSCQALVNIGWSFMTLLGQSAAQHPAVHRALSRIRLVLMQRLRASAALLQDRMADALNCPGSVNEQALANIVLSFDSTLGLDVDLLRLVFAVAAQRIQAGGTQPPFKSKELVALLSAANRLPESEPWDFLAALTRAVDSGPAGALAGWQPAEHDVYNMAVSNLRHYEAYLSSALQGVAGSMASHQQQQHLVVGQVGQFQQVGGAGGGGMGSNASFHSGGGLSSKGTSMHSDQLSRQQADMLAGQMAALQMAAGGGGGSSSNIGGSSSGGPMSRGLKGPGSTGSTMSGGAAGLSAEMGLLGTMSAALTPPPPSLQHQQQQAASLPALTAQGDIGLSLVLELISTGLLLTPPEVSKQQALWMRLSAASQASAAAHAAIPPAVNNNAVPTGAAAAGNVVSMYQDPHTSPTESAAGGALVAGRPANSGGGPPGSADS